MKRWKDRENRAQGLEGFTLVEIMIVVAIIALLTAIAIPAFLQYRRDAHLSLVANEMRLFRDAFNSYSLKYGNFPYDNEPPECTPLVALYLPMEHWTNSNPLGGRYDYDGKVNPTNLLAGGWAYAAFNIRGYTATQEELEQLDRVLDDGDISTGRLQERIIGGGQRRFVYVLEE